MEAYNIIRNAGGVGEGKGPFISLHDGFFSRNQWSGVLPNADRLSLDTHPYLCFGGQSDAPMASYAKTPCTAWASQVNASMGAFGLTNAGEWSNAVTDCGLWLNGVNLGIRYEGTYQGEARTGSCTPWTDWQNYDATMKNAIKAFALASMDALQVKQPFDIPIKLCLYFLLALRTISFGLGKSETRLCQARSKHQHGHISLVWRTDGCPRILVKPRVFAETRTHGTPLFAHGRLVVQVQVTFLPALPLPSHGLLQLLAMRAQFLSFPLTHLLAPW